MLSLRRCTLFLRKPYFTSSCFHSNNILRNNQSDASKELEDLKKNPYFDKYADKIGTFQNCSPEKFMSRLEEKKKNGKPVSKKETESGKYSQLGSPKPDITCVAVKRKLLDSVLKLDLIEDKNTEEISDIWREYHKNQDKICAVIPAKTYSLISERAKEFPVFLYPVPRSNGFEFVFSQFENEACHFTTLINYQAYKENAPECLSITHYPDLADEKGIVLMHGEFDKNILSATEAQCLANQLQLYYTCPENESKYNLLVKFSRHPSSFKHMDLIAELQNTSLTLG